MTIDYRILIANRLSQKEQKDTQQLIDSVFNEVDQVFNKWNPLSELSLLNHLSAAKPYKLSTELFAFMLQVDMLFRISGGRFDPTIEPLQRLWKEALGRGALPDSEALEKLKPYVGWSTVVFAEGFFHKQHSKTELDFGGIAKGHCVDLLLTRLQAAGFENLLVEWGGEMRASGSHPAGRPWQVAIKNFNSAQGNPIAECIALNNRAIATSGDYLQYWQVVSPDGELTTYFHVIDPFLHRPLIATTKSVATVTIIAGSCMAADAIATAAMIFPTVAESKRWLHALQRKGIIDHFWVFSRELSPQPAGNH
jgi:thiamine biosynthesis lipoprotein